VEGAPSSCVTAFAAGTGIGRPPDRSDVAEGNLIPEAQATAYHNRHDHGADRLVLMLSMEDMERHRAVAVGVLVTARHHSMYLCPGDVNDLPRRDPASKFGGRVPHDRLNADRKIVISWQSDGVDHNQGTEVPHQPDQAAGRTGLNDCRDRGAPLRTSYAAHFLDLYRRDTGPGGYQQGLCHSSWKTWDDRWRGGQPVW